MESGSFNIDSIELTNQSIDLAFYPSQNISNIEYTVYKDNEIIETNTSNNQTLYFNLEDTGSYIVSITTTDIYGNSNTMTNNYTIDKESPVIEVSSSNVEIKSGEDLDITTTAYDNIDGDITNLITSNYDSLDLTEIGEKVLTYSVSDSAGNTSYYNVNVVVTNNYLSQILVLVMIIIIASLSYLVVKIQKRLSIEKRIEQYTVKPINEDNNSLYQKFKNRYLSFIGKSAKMFRRSDIAKRYSKHLDKYVAVTDFHTNGSEILLSKVIMSLVFVIIAFVTKLIKLELVTAGDVLLSLIVGFFLLDIIYFIKYKLYRNSLENDFLSAITIMNNAFKSGRSITQAIDIVSTEMTGIMSLEFKKMSLELSYGLGIDDVFKRFEKRVKIEEVSYLTASLTILNKTGGNITEVFDSIEKSLFNKKKLKLELESLTSGSRLIVYTLFVVPFVFVIIISVISPGYFDPFIETTIGRCLLLFMIVYYLLFILCVRKIMKVVI